MPTVEEFQELCMNCTWTWTTCNNEYGYRITSRIPGYEDSSIFLPTCDDYSGLFPFHVGFQGDPVIFSDSLQSRLTGTVTAGSSAVLSVPSANNVIATFLQRFLLGLR